MFVDASISLNFLFIQAVAVIEEHASTHAAASSSQRETAEVDRDSITTPVEKERETLEDVSSILGVRAGINFLQVAALFLFV